MKNPNVIVLSSIIAFMVFSCHSPTSQNKNEGNVVPYKLTLNFQNPSVSLKTVYVCWLEDEAGNNIQNIYVCNTEVGIGKSLTGDALPYWKTVKYSSAYDTVTGASTQGIPGLSVTRNIAIGTVKRFRVCFEIDRSSNSNSYFAVDRPAFIYRSDTIDLDNLVGAPYNISLYGWMSNNTTGAYSQQPAATGPYAIPGYATYKLMTNQTTPVAIDNLQYIEPTSDMVSALSVAVMKP